MMREASGRREKAGAFVIAALAAIVASSLLAEAAPRDLFDEIYAQGQPVAATLKTLTARFTETSTSALLVKPLTASGTLTVVRPSRMVLHYSTPERRTMLIDGDVMRTVWPSRGIDQKSAVGQAQRRIQSYFVDSSPKELRSHFDILARTNDERGERYHITFVPRRKQIKEGLARLELWLSRDSVLLSSMRMTFPNGDVKQMEFADVALNPAIDPSVFRIPADQSR